jgi:hypothetical protein
MSKKIGFPVLSATITGVLFVLALLLGTLSIFISGIPTSSLDLATKTDINGFLFFIGALLAAIALISYTLHPDLDDSQRYAVAIFLVLLLLVLFNAGVGFMVSF